MESSYRLQATATEQKNTRGREREREAQEITRRKENYGAQRQ
jgi:hypothetical protein